MIIRQIIPIDLASSFSTSNVKVLKGKELPTDWLGKNWACHQLAQEAKGEYLLFVDADVELTPEVISSAVYELEKSNAALLSIFPTQIIKSFGEYLNCSAYELAAFNFSCH